MDKHVVVRKEFWDQYEELSQDYKSEYSDLTNKNHRNWVLYQMFTRMEDCQLKVALFEHLKSDGYITSNR